MRVLGKGRDVDSETNLFVVGCWEVIGSATSKWTGIDKAKKKKKKGKRKEKATTTQTGTKTQHRLLFVCFFTDFALAAVLLCLAQLVSADAF